MRGTVRQVEFGGFCAAQMGRDVEVDSSWASLEGEESAGKIPTDGRNQQTGDAASYVEKDSIIMMDAGQWVGLDKVEGVPLREPVSVVGVASALPVKVNTANGPNFGFPPAKELIALIKGLTRSLNPPTGF